MKKGDALPEFHLLSGNGRSYSPADFTGEWLVLFFYSKNNTSGCTEEVQQFVELHPDFRKSGCAVVGVSPDTAESHRRFAEKLEVPFPLLSDPAHDLTEKCGFWGKKKLYGKEYMGVIRSTVIVTPEGTVAQVFSKVRVAGHGAEVLKALRELQEG